MNAWDQLDALRNRGDPRYHRLLLQLIAAGRPNFEPSIAEMQDRAEAAKYHRAARAALVEAHRRAQGAV